MDHSFITIVSGLPRSGTSMMMQAINAGGMDALTDNIRKKDEDNPRGYYEFEPVKKTKQDASWLADARGKVVKMVYRLLYDLPAEGYEYRVVFMRRIKGRKDISIVDVNYTDMIGDTIDECIKINDFLGGCLDIGKMVSVVDGSLYRNRK